MELLLWKKLLFLMLRLKILFLNLICIFLILNSKRVVLVQIPGENLENVIKARSNIEIDINSIEGLSFYHTKCYLAKMFSNGKVVLIGAAAHPPPAGRHD